MIKRSLWLLGRFLERHLIKPRVWHDMTSETVSGGFAMYETTKVYVCSYRGKLYGFYKTIDGASGSFVETCACVLIGLRSDQAHRARELNVAGLEQLQKKQGRALLCVSLTEAECIAFLKLTDAEDVVINPN